MKLILTCFVLALFCASNAYVYQLMSEKKEGVDADCYSSYKNIGAMKIGDTKRIPDVCEVVDCSENGRMSIRGCGVAVVQPPCYTIKGDLKKDYPDCCFEIICPEENHI